MRNAPFFCFFDKWIHFPLSFPVYFGIKIELVKVKIIDTLE